MITKSCFTFLFCLSVLHGYEPQVVKLTPPVISPQTVFQEIVCTRPMREGKFNITVEQREGKTVVHCYGHGGSGWTTLFGSVERAIELFQKSHPNKEKPIRILGAGCMGLTAAIELSRLGYKVSGITTKDLYDIPSWKAPGYFALCSLKTSPEEQEELNKIGIDTFLAFQQIERGQHPYLTKECVKFMPVYCGIATEAGIEELEIRGFIPPREYVTLDFGNGVIHPGFVKYMTYFMNTIVLMREMSKEVEKWNIPVEVKELHSFSEVSEEIIFNCTGFGARELNGDDKMIPVRGHLVTLKETSGFEHMSYMIFTKVNQDGKEEYVYKFPQMISVTADNLQGSRCMGTIGGTFITDFESLSPEEQKKLDQKEFKKLLDRNSQFFQGKTFTFECQTR